MTLKCLSCKWMPVKLVMFEYVNQTQMSLVRGNYCHTRKLCFVIGWVVLIFVQWKTHSTVMQEFFVMIQEMSLQETGDMRMV